MNRIFVIPDIHGRHDLLEKLLAKLFDIHNLFDEEGDDKLIFLGDMVDRGPASAKVLAHVKLLTETYDGCIALFGNHERLMLDGLGPDAGKKFSDHPWSYTRHSLWMVNGGDQTLLSYPDKKVSPEHIAWLGSLPLFHQEPGFFFAHAPLPTENRRKVKGVPFTEEELTWEYHRDECGSARRFEKDPIPPFDDSTPREKIVGVCGHVHRLQDGIDEPRFYDHYIFADAGCGCGARAPLVAIEVRTRETVYARPE